MESTSLIVVKPQRNYSNSITPTQHQIVTLAPSNFQTDTAMEILNTLFLPLITTTLPCLHSSQDDRSFKKNYQTNSPTRIPTPSQASLPNPSQTTNPTPNPHHTMPSKQTFHALTASTCEILTDLTCSLIGYYILIHTLYSGIGTIVWAIFHTHWTYDQTDLSPGWHEDIIRGTVLSLWGLRFALRWRGHLVCFLRWMSPLWPEAVGLCACCGIAVRGEPDRGEEGRIDGWREERGVGIFL